MVYNFNFNILWYVILKSWHKTIGKKPLAKRK